MGMAASVKGVVGILMFLLTGAGGVAVWLGCAAFVYIDATRRHVRSAPLWALGTALLGPVALVAYLIDRPKAPQVSCAFCGQTILETDGRCPYCGRDAME